MLSAWHEWKASVVQSIRTSAWGFSTGCRAVGISRDPNVSLRILCADFDDSEFSSLSHLLIRSSLPVIQVRLRFLDIHPSCSNRLRQVIYELIHWNSHFLLTDFSRKDRDIFLLSKPISTFESINRRWIKSHPSGQDEELHTRPSWDQLSSGFNLWSWWNTFRTISRVLILIVALSRLLRSPYRSIHSGPVTDDTVIVWEHYSRNFFQMYYNSAKSSSCEITVGRLHLLFVVRGVTVLPSECTRIGFTSVDILWEPTCPRIILLCSSWRFRFGPSHYLILLLSRNPVPFVIRQVVTRHRDVSADANVSYARVKGQTKIATKFPSQ